MLSLEIRIFVLDFLDLEKKEEILFLGIGVKNFTKDKFDLEECEGRPQASFLFSFVAMVITIRLFDVFIWFLVFYMMIWLFNYVMKVIIKYLLDYEKNWISYNTDLKNEVQKNN